MDLTKITTPFGLLDEATQKALKEHGGPYERYTDDGKWVAWPGTEIWWKAAIYRVKIEPPKPREWWIVPSLGTGWHYATLQDAICSNHPDLIVHVREVL